MKFVVRGLSTTRISHILFISEHTVQNHLRSVFEKVGVCNRGELVKRLFSTACTRRFSGRACPVAHDISQITSAAVTTIAR